MIKVGARRYFAFMNMNRWKKADAQDRGAAPTPTVSDRDFTGQRHNRAVGLLYYKARCYLPHVLKPDGLCYNFPAYLNAN